MMKWSELGTFDGASSFQVTFIGSSLDVMARVLPGALTTLSPSATVFTVPVTFPHGGIYLSMVSFEAKQNGKSLAASKRQRLTVTGAPQPAGVDTPIRVAKTRGMILSDRSVVSAANVSVLPGQSGYQVGLQLPSSLYAGQTYKGVLSFSAISTTGALSEITDLVSFLGAPVHVTYVREGLCYATRTRALTTNGGGGHHHGSAAMVAGPKVSAFFTFPEEGRYRVWVEARRSSVAIVTPFLVDVS